MKPRACVRPVAAEIGSACAQRAKREAEPA
jgi:hypothetical protein